MQNSKSCFLCFDFFFQQKPTWKLGESWCCQVSYSGQGKETWMHGNAGGHLGMLEAMRLFFAQATSLHGECAAQLMLQDMKAKDAKRVEDGELGRNVTYSNL